MKSNAKSKLEKKSINSVLAFAAAFLALSLTGCLKEAASQASSSSSESNNLFRAVSAQNIDASSVLVSWDSVTDASLDVIGYSIFNSSDLTNPIETVDSEQDSYVVTGLSEFEAKSYVVRFVSSNSSIKDTNTQSVKAMTFGGGTSVEVDSYGSTLKILVPATQAQLNSISSWKAYGYFTDTSSWEAISGATFSNGYLSFSPSRAAFLTKVRARIIPKGLVEDGNLAEIKVYSAPVFTSATITTIDQKTFGYGQTLTVNGTCTANATLSKILDDASNFNMTTNPSVCSSVGTFQYKFSIPDNSTGLRTFAVQQGDSSGNLGFPSTTLTFLARSSEAGTYFERVTGLSIDHKADINDFIVGMKIENLYSKLIEGWLLSSDYNLSSNHVESINGITDLDLIAPTSAGVAMPTLDSEGRHFYPNCNPVLGYALCHGGVLVTPLGTATAMEKYLNGSGLPNSATYLNVGLTFIGMAKVFPNAVPTHETGIYYFGVGSPSGGYGPYVGINSFAGVLMQNEARPGASYSYVSPIPASQSTFKNWHTVAFVQTPGDHRNYINDLLLGTSTDPAGPSGAQYTHWWRFGIGATSDGNYGINGAMASAMFFAGALTADEISTIRNIYKNTVGKDLNLP